HVGYAARRRQDRGLEGERLQEGVDALGRLADLEPLAQLRVLGGDADRAAPGVAVVALAGRHADRALVVGDAGDLLVAVERHQRRVADGDRLRAQGEALGAVAAVAAPAGRPQVGLA